MVQDENAYAYVQVFTELWNADSIGRFKVCDYRYIYAYLIEPPAGPKYKPFESVEKAMDAIKKHGGWLERKSDGLQGIVVAKSSDRIKAVQCWYRLGDMFQSLVFADDGSPCGELVEG